MNAYPANWYPDPSGRHELRYYDGSAWTEHVSDHGATGVDHQGSGRPAAAPQQFAAPSASSGGGFAPPSDRQQVRVRQQVSGSGYGGAGIQTGVGGGSGSIFDEPVLVVNQKAKLIELTNEYSVFDQHGTQIAQVTQIGQSAAKKALRLLTKVDALMGHKLEISDRNGPQLVVHKPRALLKATVIVSDPHEREIGKIVQEKLIGKINFRLEDPHGQTIGAIKGENWRAWDFRIEDATGTEVARVTKTFEGFMRAAFTTADKYVVQIHARQPEPLNSLIVAAALSIDTVLKQNDA